jgi:hypothetical protein
MSLQSWLEEFYPTPADDPQNSGDALAAAKHSLQKWRGLTAESLSNPGVSRIGDRGIGNIDTSLKIDILTCSLCHYSRGVCKRGKQYCNHCPLFKTEGVECDVSDELEGQSLFHQWEDDDNPQPMIEAIQRTVDRLTNSYVKPSSE